MGNKHKNILLLGNMYDMQTGIYVASAFKQAHYHVSAIDTRLIIETFDSIAGQDQILREINKQKVKIGRA